MSLRPRHSHKTLLVTVCLLGLSSFGCRISAPERARMNPSLQARADVAVTSEQLRLRMRSLVDPLCGLIEAAADQIMKGATNPAVQREALLWKIEAVPALRQALFQPDPFTALTDTWVLSCQMEEYFENGPGKEKLAEAHSVAATACQRLEADLAQLAASLTKSGDVSKGRAFVQKWAAAHPIRTSIAARESTLSRATERDLVSSFSATEAVGNITVTVDDLNRRLEVYSDQLFRQARWEAELFKADLLSDLPLDQALPLAERAVKSAEQAVATVNRLAPSIERALGVAEGVPKLVTSEREAAIKALQDELARTIKFVQEERIAAFGHLTKERVSAIQDLQSAMVAERKALTVDLDQISLKVVDHALWRVAQLVAATLVVLLLAAVVGLFLVRWIFFWPSLEVRNGRRAN